MLRGVICGIGERVTGTRLVPDMGESLRYKHMHLFVRKTREGLVVKQRR
jgi:hypothetical protein